ncbi:uncharacterized protein LOC144476492 isoform X2 [Augochlora pura]
MGLTCCFRDCKEKQKSNEKISFHQFPKDPELRKQWIQVVQRENFKPSSQTKVCSKHFSNDCFIQSGWSSRRILKRDAVPNTTLDESEIHYTCIRELHPISVVWIKSDNTSASIENVFEKNDVHRVNGNQENVPPKALSRRKRKAYVGDFGDCSTIEDKDNYMRIMNRTLTRKNKQIISLQEKNRHLTKNVNVLQSLLKNLKHNQRFNENISVIRTVGKV